MTFCKLGINPKSKTQDKCHPEECEKCGWEVQESLRRENLLKAQGLTKGKDGLWRLEG